MRRFLQSIAGLSIAVAVTGCGGTVNYNPATTTDSTPPAVNLLIRIAGQSDLEVQKQSVPAPMTPTNATLGDLAMKKKLDFSVLATATDAESGIKSIKLSMTRTVCYMSSGGNLAQAYFGSVERKAATSTDPKNAPVQLSVGDTGIVDNSENQLANGTMVPANLFDENLLVWKNANQLPSLGIGVSTKWFMEAKNFNGSTTYSDPIFIRAGDTSCVTGP